MYIHYFGKSVNNFIIDSKTGCIYVRQVPEFLCFRNRLRTSYILCQTRIELSIIESLQTIIEDNLRTKKESKKGYFSYDAHSIARSIISKVSGNFDDHLQDGRGMSFLGEVSSKAVSNAFDNSDMSQCPEWFKNHSDYCHNKKQRYRPHPNTESCVNKNDRLLLRYLLAKLLHDLSTVVIIAQTTESVSKACDSTLETCQNILTYRSAEEIAMDRSWDMGCDLQLNIVADVAQTITYIITFVQVQRNANSNKTLDDNDNKGESHPETNHLLQAFTASFGNLMQSVADCYRKSFSVDSKPLKVTELPGCLHKLNTLVNEVGMIIIVEIIMVTTMILPPSKSKRKKKKNEDSDVVTKFLKCLKHGTETVIKSIETLLLNLKIQISELEERRKVGIKNQSNEENSKLESLISCFPPTFQENTIEIYGNIVDAQIQETNNIIEKAIVLKSSFQDFEF